MEVPRLWVQSELLPPTYARATAVPDLSHVCYLHHSSQQRWIHNPLSKATDRICTLMDVSQIRFRCTTMGSPLLGLFEEDSHLGTARRCLVWDH